jgi:hypothetical protein
MMSSCPEDWNDPSTRHHCEHPDATYQDPLFDVPVTSYRTNITYRNWHCALCHHDLDAGTTDIWSIYFSCGDAWLNISNDEIVSHLAYNTSTSSWVLNMSAYPEELIFDNPKPTTLVYNCSVEVWPTDWAQTVLRSCNRRPVDMCPEDWTDEFVRAQCENSTQHVCLGDTVYYNRFCGICNNNGSFDGLACYMFDKRIGSPSSPTDFTVLLNWHLLRERATCQQDTEQYDPFKYTCRSLFMEGQSKCKLR